MLLDKLLFNKIKPLGLMLLKKAGLKTYPKNIDEMTMFLHSINKSIAEKEFADLLIANILFSFVSSIEVRDRKTTARTFEDIFSGLFGLSATDVSLRQNPTPPQYILDLNRFNTENDTFKISTDLATNKREKADLLLGEYSISLKTLRGIAYDENDEVMPRTIRNSEGELTANNENGELNVGSLSYRALLKGILSDEEISNLKDRKGGLGSGSAIRQNILNKVKLYKKEELFYLRLKAFLNYVYDDDIYIVLKSNFRIKWILIPAESFVEAILKTYLEDEEFFEKIWYRWENNNLRLYWRPLLQKLEEYNLKYNEINMFLGDAVKSNIIQQFKDKVSKNIENEIGQLLEKQVEKVIK